jgi:SAM-dependent methyltransferase
MDQKERTAAYWSRPESGPPRTRWWQSRTIVRHINKRICGLEVDGTEGGDIELIRQIARRGALRQAVSIGCGNAHHELKLLASGVVEHFVLYENAEPRVRAAQSKAAELGLSERIDMRMTDAFKEPVRQSYDLVYWKDALYHMFDARAAVDWSYAVLRQNGIFYMNEFVGPTRMQYTARQLDLAERARACLPERCLADPRNPDGPPLPHRRVRPKLDAMLATDPSECADSERILPAVSSRFPGATVKPTGGVIYALALSDVLANLDEDTDRALIKAMMLADDLCIEAGETLYAVAFGFKR